MISSTTFIDTGVENGASYFYRVAAVNQSGTGPASDTAKATPVAAGPLPPRWTHHQIGEITGKDTPIPPAMA